MSGSERKDFGNDQLRGVMGKYFTELCREPEQGKKTAWCTSVGPAELLRAMGFNVYFPENHGAMLGASRMAADLIPLANAQGFSPEICSYLTSDIGSFLKGESPIQKMNLPGPPRPDVLVYNTNQCRDVKDWFQYYARHWNVPCLGVHTPLRDRRSRRRHGGLRGRANPRPGGAAGAGVRPKLADQQLEEVVGLSHALHGALAVGARGGGPRAGAVDVLRRHNPDGAGRRAARHPGRD